MGWDPIDYLPLTPAATSITYVVNLENPKHWVVVNIALSSMHFTYFDGYTQQKNLLSLSTAIQKATSHLQRKFEHFGFVWPQGRRTIEWGLSPEQTDSNNCGPWACYNVAQILGLYDFIFNDLTPLAVRTQVATSISDLIIRVGFVSPDAQTRAQIPEESTLIQIPDDINSPTTPRITKSSTRKRQRSLIPRPRRSKRSKRQRNRSRHTSSPSSNTPKDQYNGNSKVESVVLDKVIKASINRKGPFSTRYTSIDPRVSSIYNASQPIAQKTVEKGCPWTAVIRRRGTDELLRCCLLCLVCRTLTEFQSNQQYCIYHEGRLDQKGRAHL